MSMKSPLSIILILFLLGSGGCSKDKNPVKEDDFPFDPPSTTPLDPFAQNQLLGGGVNLGNALEAPAEGEWGVTLEEKYFQLIKDAGFKSVRIPTRWSAHAKTAAPYTIDATFFERLDWAVGQALSRGLAVVLNIHHYEEIISNPSQHKDRFLAIWKQLAEHYKNYPDQLFFELLNEPNGNLSASIWNAYLKEAISLVRQTNPYRMIIVGPVSWNAISALSSLQLPEEDRGIIVTVHYYNPFQFTHQGAEWVSGSDAWLGTKWTSTNAEKALITGELDQAKAWGIQKNRPIFVGEFGSYSKADIASRALWTTFVARQAESRNMSWAYWEFCAGFGVYDRTLNDWNYPLLRALIPNLR